MHSFYQSCFETFQAIYPSCKYALLLFYFRTGGLEVITSIIVILLCSDYLSDE